MPTFNTVQCEYVRKQKHVHLLARNTVSLSAKNPTHISQPETEQQRLPNKKKN